MSDDGCQATTRAGEPCRSPPVRGRPYCFHHDPERARERTAARRRGGLAAHGLDGRVVEGVEVRSTDDVLRLLENAAGDLLAGKPSLGRARALAYLAGVCLKALEVGALEERVAALEARAQVGGATPRAVA